MLPQLRDLDPGERSYRPSSDCQREPRGLRLAEATQAPEEASAVGEHP